MAALTICIVAPTPPSPPGMAYTAEWAAGLGQTLASCAELLPPAPRETAFGEEASVAHEVQTLTLRQTAPATVSQRLTFTAIAAGYFPALDAPPPRCFALPDVTMTFPQAQYADVWGDDASDYENLRVPTELVDSLEIGDRVSFSVTATSTCSSELTFGWANRPKGCLLYTSPSPRDS